MFFKIKISKFKIFLTQRVRRFTRKTHCASWDLASFSEACDMPTRYQAIIAALRRKEEQQEPGKQYYHEPEDQKRPNAMPKLRCATPKHDSAIVAKHSVPKKRGARADKKQSNASPIGPTSMIIRMLFARSVSTSRLLTKRRFCMLASHYGLTRHRKCSAGTLDLIYMRVSIKHFVVLRIQHPRQFASC